MGTHPIFESDFRLSNRVVWEMSFGDVSSAAGLEKLNAILLDNSYAGGWVPTQVDVELFNAIKSSPDTYQNVLRWWNNIASYKSEFASLPAGSASAAPAAAEEEDDDDVDLFASDDEVDEEAEKGKVIAKSNIILDIKPWDDETDLEAMEKSIRSITMDGLLWGTGKFVPVGYGIKKLQITCVIEDDKVMMDDLEDQVTG